MISYLEKNKRFSILFTVLIAAEIFFVSSVPGSRVITEGLDLSAAYHSIVFFLLGFFTILSMTNRKDKKMTRLLLPVGITILYAIVDEIHQIFVPLRSSSITDVLIDISGILLAVIVYLYYKRDSKKK